MKIKDAVPYFISVFAISFIQMGSFIFFQRWLSFSYTGVPFLWRSALLQLLLLLPYIFMLTPASYFSNRYPKNRVMAWSALLITIVLLLIAVFFTLGFGWVSYGLILLLSMFSAIESPAKLGIQKELFGARRLTLSNAYESSFAILGVVAVSFFTIGFSPEETSFFKFELLPWLFVAVGGVATISAFRIPAVVGGSESMKMRSPKRTISSTWSNPLLRLCIIGLAFFWGIAQIFILLSQDISGMHVVSVLRNSLIFSAVGLVLGFFVAARASRNFIETGLIPIAALGAALMMFFSAFTSNEIVLALIYGVIGFCAGLFFTLVKALLQHNTKPDTAGRIISVANMMQMLFLFAFLAIQLLAMAFTSVSIDVFFIPLAIIAFIGFSFSLIKTPQTLLRAFLRLFFFYRYRLKPIGIKNIPESGPVLLIGSHYSFVDWAVLQMACPRPILIASNYNRYERWYFRWIKKQLGMIFINRRHPEPAIEEIKQALLESKVVVIFPEGEVSKSPFISRFSIDYSPALNTTNAPIVPFYIHGVWGGPYSYASESIAFPHRKSRIVSVGFAPPLPPQSSEDQIRESLRDLSVDVWDNTIRHYKQIVPLWLRAMKSRVRFKVSIFNINGNHVSGYEFVRMVLALNRKVKKETLLQKHVGFMFPPSPEGFVTFLGILSYAKTSVNLNYTAAPDTIFACIDKTEVETIFTTKAFFEKMCQKDTRFKDLESLCHLIFVDEFLASSSIFSWVHYQLIAIFVPARLIELSYFKKSKLGDTASILFSSGSEGVPKGIMLTHKNFISNILQTDAVVRVRSNDVMLSELPMFHSFGLTANILLSLVNGIPTVPCPDPTDIKTMARVCAEFKATLLMGTPSFLRAFTVNRWVHPMCLDNMRLVLAGAEKMRPELRESFRIKFGKEIYEVYGCTETTPVATMNSANTLLDDFLTMEKCNEPGSVGMPVPGTRLRIVDPETNEDLPTGEEGMVLIAGPQVMKGYFKEPEKTAAAILEQNGKRWYRTGDKAYVDKDGFLVIVDRYSRFAKLGGEMVSLGAVDLRIGDTKILEGCDFVSTSIPSEVKGESIVVLYSGEKDAHTVFMALRKSGIPPLMIPDKVFKVDSIPKLGSGKSDFTAIKIMARELATKS